MKWSPGLEKITGIIPASLTRCSALLDVILDHHWETIFIYVAQYKGSLRLSAMDSGISSIPLQS